MVVLLLLLLSSPHQDRTDRQTDGQNGMDKFQRERTRNNRPATAPNDKVIAKKRSSLGRAAGGFQSKLLASLRSKRKSGAGDEVLAPSSGPSRYVPVSPARRAQG